MTEQEVSVKLAETEQRARSNTHRIERLEQQQKDLNKLVTAVEVLSLIHISEPTRWVWSAT